MSHGIAILIFRINNQHHAKQHQQHQHPPPISHIRMDVTWKYKLACAKSRGSAQCSPEILAEHHKPTPQPMHKTQNNKRNTTQKVHSHGRHQAPPPSPHLPTPAWRSNTNGSPMQKVEISTVVRGNLRKNSENRCEMPNA